MDLLACTVCSERFYGVVSPSHESCWCPHCGTDVEVAEHDITSIPLDARWLGPSAQSVDPPRVTIVDLRRKRQHRRKSAKRIATQLGDYFPVRPHGRLLEVAVNRGESDDAALRVAAVLDGVDPSWERYFYLPTSKPQQPAHQRHQRAPVSRAHLRAVPPLDAGFGPDGSA
jgi:hypothetical protein